MGYYMCRGGGKRFVAAGSRPRNLCACKPLVPSSFPCQSLVGASPKPRKRSNGRFLCALRAHVLACLCAKWRVLRSGGVSFCVAPSFSRFFGGFPPQPPGSCLTVVFCARCGLTSSRAYVLSGGCSAVVIGRFCVWLSPRPAALRSAAFALRAPACGLSPAAAFPAVGRSFPPVY